MDRWLTPNAAGGMTTCRVLVIPVELLPSVNGALQQLAEEYNWEEFGTMTAADAAALCDQMVRDFYNSDGGACP